MNCRQCGEFSNDTFCSEECADLRFEETLAKQLAVMFPAKVAAAGGRYREISADVPLCPGCGGRHYSAVKGDGRRVWCDGTADKGNGKGTL